MRVIWYGDVEQSSKETNRMNAVARKMVIEQMNSIASG